MDEYKDKEKIAEQAAIIDEYREIVANRKEELEELKSSINNFLDDIESDLYKRIKDLRKKLKL